jgi:crotonobetaine/carnitine-CoA ligase
VETDAGQNEVPSRPPAEADLTIPAVLDWQAGIRPDQPMLHVSGEAVTYAEMRARSISAANAFASLGIGSGDRVAIFMANSLDWISAWFGASRLGAVVVPVNIAYRGDFLENQLADAQVKAVVTHSALFAEIDRAAARLPALEMAIVRTETTETSEASEPDRVSELRVVDAGILTSADPTTVEVDVRLSWRQPAAIFFTSGTTGRSKGALVTQHYLLTAARTIADCWQLQPGEVVYAPLPLFHLSALGSVLGPMIAGGTGVLEATFSVSRTWDRVRQFKAAGIALAGPMMTMLWNQPPDDRDRTIPIRFLSAAPVSRDLYRAVEARFDCQIVTMYGLTEAFPLTMAGVGADNPPGSSGRRNPDFDVAIFDEDDHELPAGEVGEIVCRPKRPHVMFERYDGQDAATVEQTRSLWFHTGDLGVFDEAGHFTYVDRKKDAIRRRGENISSFEIEQSILGHPAVAEVAAIAVPSELGEDDVMVCVVPAGGETLEVEDLMDFCTARLPKFAVPRYVDVVADLPKNAMGRVLKPLLRERGVTASTWDRERSAQG